MRDIIPIFYSFILTLQKICPFIIAFYHIFAIKYMAAYYIQLKKMILVCLMLNNNHIFHANITYKHAKIALKVLTELSCSNELFG